MVLVLSPWICNAERRLHKLLKEQSQKKVLKFLGVLMSPTEGHYQHSLPMDSLEQETGCSDDRQAKPKCWWL